MQIDLRFEKQPQKVSHSSTPSFERWETWRPRPIWKEHWPAILPCESGIKESDCTRFRPSIYCSLAGLGDSNPDVKRLGKHTPREPSPFPPPPPPKRRKTVIPTLSGHSAKVDEATAALYFQTISRIAEKLGVGTLALRAGDGPRWEMQASGGGRLGGERELVELGGCPGREQSGGAAEGDVRWEPEMRTEDDRNGNCSETLTSYEGFVPSSVIATGDVSADVSVGAPAIGGVNGGHKMLRAGGEGARDADPFEAQEGRQFFDFAPGAPQRSNGLGSAREGGRMLVSAGVQTMHSAVRHHLWPVSSAPAKKLVPIRKRSVVGGNVEGDQRASKAGEGSPENTGDEQRLRTAGQTEASVVTTEAEGPVSKNVSQSNGVHPVLQDRFTIDASTAGDCTGTTGIVQWQEPSQMETPEGQSTRSLSADPSSTCSKPVEFLTRRSGSSEKSRPLSAVGLASDIACTPRISCQGEDTGAAFAGDSDPGPLQSSAAVLEAQAEQSVTGEAGVNKRQPAPPKGGVNNSVSSLEQRPGLVDDTHFREGLSPLPGPTDNLFEIEQGPVTHGASRSETDSANLHSVPSPNHHANSAPLQPSAHFATLPRLPRPQEPRANGNGAHSHYHGAPYGNGVGAVGSHEKSPDRQPPRGRRKPANRAAAASKKVGENGEKTNPFRRLSGMSLRSMAQFFRICEFTVLCVFFLSCGFPSAAPLCVRRCSSQHFSTVSNTVAPVPRLMILVTNAPAVAPSLFSREAK
jgi:hypothetical protein